MSDGKCPFYPLSPLDSLAPRDYIQELLYFPAVADPTNIFTTLRKALAHTIAEIPILAGCVGSNVLDAQKGTLVVEGPYLIADDMISVKDLRDFYSYTDLRAKRFPPDAIAGNICIPNLPKEPPRVMLAQLNILRGGIMLFVAVFHSVMDGTGVLNILRVWSGYCRRGHGTKLVRPHWSDGGPLQRQGDALSEDILIKPSTPHSYFVGGSETIINYPRAHSTVEQPRAKAAVFFFSDVCLARLKIAATKANSTVGDEDRQSTDWISTNDALSALLWCSITSAREGDAAKTSTTVSWFRMAVDCRSRLSPPISLDYIGNTALLVKAQATPEYLLSAYPSRIADVASLI